jgi:sulfate/thiosulfate transport system substrate-binding protein
MRTRYQMAVYASLAAVGLASAQPVLAAKVRILNVASNVTRGFFQDYNAAFAAYWKEKTGETVIINQTNGDSREQSQSVIGSVDADVVALDEPADVDALFNHGRFLDANWAERLPNRSAPFSSTIVFLVRKGNLWDVRNWDDLVRPDILVVTANPKTSSEGRYSYLGAWGYALEKPAGDQKAARRFVARLFARALISGTGGSAASLFAGRGFGDVLLTYESEAALIQKQFPDKHFEVVLPPVSIATENVVAWLDHDVERHGNEAVARAYLEYLYSDAGQELAAQHFFRPGNETILERYSTRYKPLELLTVDEIAGGWQKAMQVHFADGGVFDHICFNRPTGSPEVFQNQTK